MANKCKECGCTCKQCLRKISEIHLHTEIENLQQRLLERDNHIVTMETQFLNDANKFPNGELASIREEILIWQDKYSRLYEAHKRIQKINQNLEDKLLRIVDKCETEKGAFTKDIATLSHRLADANYAIHRLKQDNLSLEVQDKVRSYMSQKNRPLEDQSNNDVKSITVPISSFPPTAMIYSVSKSLCKNPVIDESTPPVDIVSASVMARVLEEREKERIFGKHCGTCTCSKTILKVDNETQTESISNVPSRGPIVIDFADVADCCANLQINGQYNSKFQNSELKRNNKNEEGGKLGHRYTSSLGRIVNRTSRLDEGSYNWSQTNGKDAKVSKKREEGREMKKTRQEEIINDRLYKNSWKKYSDNMIEHKESRKTEKIEAINDRVWRKTKSAESKSDQLTVIEVADEPAMQSQPTETASPSFSSDSVVISSSDPSSLSSDAKFTEKSSSRNCLVRVKPGSKNILLDSIGTYQTVLYTSGSERPSTILVHSKPRLDRSGSNSEGNEPSQLQRVAEWVESSSAIKDELSQRKSIRRPQKVLPIFEIQTKDEVKHESKEKDLITFEASSEEDGFRDPDYEVKVTKEMEETYLKLTASLDPAVLKLDESARLGITIEKYRQDHKKGLQKMKTHCS